MHANIDDLQRTTLSSHGCELLEELAKLKQPGLDTVFEITVPHLVKLCGSTKKITASKAEETVNTILANAPYSVYMLRQIWCACEDKNVQPRKAATLWLKTLIGRHRANKRIFEKGDGLAWFERCLKKGLSDSNADVRKSMRAAYWAFIRLWPERSEGILSTLTDQHRKVLVTETADMESVPSPVKDTAVAIAKSAAPKPKPSIKDAIAAKRQAAKAEKAKPEPKISTSSSSHPRPAGKVEKSNPESKISTSSSHPRPAGRVEKPDPETKTSTSSSSNARPATTRTLSSAPVRPSRFLRKPTATSKPLTLDLSKSAMEVPRASNTDRPITPDQLPDDEEEDVWLQIGRESAAAAAAERPRSAASMIETITEMAYGALSPIIDMANRAMSPKSENPNSPTWRPQTPEKDKQPLSPGSIANMAKWRPQTPEEDKQPLSPGTIASMAKAGWDAVRETEKSPPAPTDTPVTVVRRSSKESEALRQMSVARPEKPIMSRKEGIARKVLRDLHVNEPTTRKLRDLTKIDVKDMSAKEKLRNVERIHRRASPRIKHQSTDALRKEMRAHLQVLKGPFHLVRIENYHKVQSIIKSGWLVLEDEPEGTDLFDETLFAIISQLEEDGYSFHGVHPTGMDRNTQLLLILRLLLEHHCNLMTAYLPRIFCALMAGSRNQRDDTHMRPLLQQTAKDLIRECTVADLEDAIDAVLDVIETHPSPSAHPQELSMGLYMLVRLMRRSRIYSARFKPEEQERRIALLGARVSKSKYPELRQQACDLLIEYRLFLADDDKFWANVSSIGHDVSRLLTYYYEKELTEQRLESERLLLQRAMADEVD